jgi:2,3-bisphosphoglycerate-independent phosphoglycerate mutase
MNVELKKSALIIVDGLGLAGDETASAITRRTMPYLHSLMDRYGFATLEASGTAIGLDEGQAGNSEVGHLTIGAGRVLPTMLSRLRAAYANGEWTESPVWKSMPATPRIHVVGMLSAAGVHAHWSSIVQAATIASAKGFERVYLHLFLDGVDSPAGSAPALLDDLRNAIASNRNIRIATISGRKWAADRSGDLSISEHCAAGLFGKLEHHVFRDDALRAHLDDGQTEAAFPCHYADLEGTIRPGDLVVMTQHRVDRLRQLAGVLAPQTDLYSVAQIAGVVPPERAFFPVRKLTQGLVHSLSDLRIHATRIAESCKFPHVTFFMNGMRDDTHKTAIEIPSLPDEQIAKQPKMNLEALQASVQHQLIQSHDRSLIVNLPNLDQVGHTGDLALAEQAACHIDEALRRIAATAHETGWTLVITADHGNADRMADDQGRPLGSHSTNPVPLLVVDATGKKREFKRTTGTLANVAATYLATLGIAAPSYMDESLIEL